MTELAFRAYVEGDNIVVVAFPNETEEQNGEEIHRGGDAVLRKEVSLDTLGLKCTRTPPNQLDVPYGTFSVKHRQDLVRGGLELIVNYDAERIKVVPYTRTGMPIEDYAVRYRFSDFGLEDNRQNKIQKAKSKDVIRISKDKQPLSDETWP